MTEAISIIYTINYHINSFESIKIHGIVTNKWLQKNKHVLHAWRVQHNGKVMIVPLDVFVEKGVVL